MAGAFAQMNQPAGTLPVLWSCIQLRRRLSGVAVKLSRCLAMRCRKATPGLCTQSTSIQTAPWQPQAALMQSVRSAFACTPPLSSGRHLQLLSVHHNEVLVARFVQLKRQLPICREGVGPAHRSQHHDPGGACEGDPGA